MINRIKAALSSPIWVFAIPVLLPVLLYVTMVGIGVCGWDGFPVPVQRVEDGGTITLNRSEFDRLLEAEYVRGVKCGIWGEWIELADGTAIEVPPAGRHKTRQLSDGTWARLYDDGVIQSAEESTAMKGRLLKSGYTIEVSLPSEGGTLK